MGCNYGVYVYSTTRVNIIHCGIKESLKCWSDHEPVLLFLRQSRLSKRIFKSRRVVVQRDFRLDEALAAEREATSYVTVLGAIQAVLPEIPLLKKGRVNQGWFEADSREIEELLQIRRVAGNTYRVSGLCEDKVAYASIKSRVQKNLRLMENNYFF